MTVAHVTNVKGHHLKSQLNNPEPAKLHVVWSPNRWTHIDTNKPVPELSFQVILTLETVATQHSREEPSDCRLLRN